MLPALLTMLKREISLPVHATRSYLNRASSEFTALMTRRSLPSGPCFEYVTEPSLDFGGSSAGGGPWAGKFVLLLVFCYM
jgi:hypothetical protein